MNEQRAAIKIQRNFRKFIETKNHIMTAPSHWFSYLAKSIDKSEIHRTAYFATLWTMWEYKRYDPKRPSIDQHVRNKLKKYHDSGWEEATIWQQRFFGNEF